MAKKAIKKNVTAVANQIETPIPVKRRGRPPGSKKSLKDITSLETNTEVVVTKRKRGRPPGSKNKPKEQKLLADVKSLTIDLRDIHSLIGFVSKSGIAEVILETQGVKIVIRTTTGKTTTVAAPITVEQPVASPPPIVASVPTSTPTPTTPASSSPAVDESKYITIKSPMIGTFYRRPAPDKPVFVNVGDEIKPGKVLCIIEAMKLFNEIEAEVSGRIVKILVDDATPVEYDQPLFLVDPS